MKRNGQNLIPYNLKKALLYLQRAKMIAVQSRDLETARDLSISIIQVSTRIKKLNDNK